MHFKAERKFFGKKKYYDLLQTISLNITEV